MESPVFHMIIEQTKAYPMRMIYHPDTGEFIASAHVALAQARNFTKPYGWIKESGTPPEPQWDCILMTNKDYELGDEVEVKVIGVFKRADFDHKYIVAETVRDIDDYEELSPVEKEELCRLYPRIGEGEGWFGKEEAYNCMKYHKKAL